jgi:chaperonin GroES
VTTATKVVLKPLEDRIVVRTLEAEQTTASGLVIPDTAKEKPQEGEVLAVGPGRFDDAGAKRVPMDVKVGDVVLYSKYGGTEVKYSGGAASACGRLHPRRHRPGLPGPGMLYFREHRTARGGCTTGPALVPAAGISPELKDHILSPI